MITVPPYLADSCVFYLRQFGNPSGGTVFRDWSKNFATITTHGTVVNTTSNPIFPPASINFDGSSGYLTLPLADRFTLGGNNFAVHFCIYPTSENAGSFVRIDANTSGGGYGALSIGRVDATHIYILYSTTGTSWDNISNYQQAATLTTNTKAFVDVIRSGSNLTAYVNGTQIYQWTGVGTLWSGAIDYGVIVGYNNSGTPLYYAGNIDELGIWNGAYGPVPTISQLSPQTRRMIA